MRKFFPFLILLIFFRAYPVFSQTITNGSFELWNQVDLYEVPDIVPPTSESQTSNEQSFKHGVLTMTKIPGVTGDAVHLETMEVQGDTWKDTTAGYIVWGGEPSDQGGVFTFKGGFPFSEQNVTSLSVDLKYSINAASPGIILVQFKKNGVAIGGGNAPLFQPGIYAFMVSGDQSSFITMNFPISPALPEPPDTAAIAFASNNALDQNATLYPGDFLDVDNVSFVGTTQNIPGGDLDTWKELPPIELPMDWEVETEDSLYHYLKSGDATDGSFSLYLESYYRASHGYKSVSSARIGEIEGYSGGTNYYGGMPLFNKPAMLTFSYKGMADQPDTAIVRAAFLKYDTNTETREYVGEAYLRLPLSGGTWKDTGVVVTYFGGMPDPDSVIFSIEGASYGNNNPHAEFWIDDMMLHYCSDPIMLEGPYTLCANASGVEYSVKEALPGSNYVWTVPAGATITSATDTNSITVDFGATFGQVKAVQIYNNGCANDTAIIDVTEATGSIVSANAPLTVCEGDPIQLEGFFSGAAGATWSTATGDGSFTDINDMFAQYFPGTNDNLSGSVTVTLTTYGSGDCGETSDNVTIAIVERPTPDAGISFAVCEDQTSISLNGTTGDPSATVNWMSGGDGNFDDNTILAPVYTLGTNDLTAGNITFTLNAYNSGCFEQDFVTVMRQALPGADAGDDIAICTGGTAQLLGQASNSQSVLWESSGTGSFDNDGSLSAVYTPSADDELAGMVTLTLNANGLFGCPPASSNTMLTISVCTGNSAAETAYINIYPNPASGTLFIETDANFSPEKIQLLDQYSREVRSANGTGKITSLDVSEVPAGVYFLITTGNGVQKAQKVVIE